MSSTHSSSGSLNRTPSLKPDDSKDSEPVEIQPGPTSLARVVYSRRPEYTRPHRIRIKIGTWNVAQNPPSAFDLRKWFFQPAIDGLLEQPQLPPRVSTLDSTQSNSFHLEVNNGPRLPCKNRIGLYVLGLQEATPSNIGQRIINTEPVVEDHWSDSIADSIPPGYVRVAREVMGGIILLIYAATDLAPSISHVSAGQVGTGLMGFYGNKGGVSVRLLLGDTTRLLFTNSHLASGSEPQFLERRCWDANTIKSRTSFAPVNLPGGPDSGPENIGDEDLAFWLGDLNFRLDAPGEDIRGLFSLHTQGMYGIPDEPSTPISLASSSSIMEPTESYDSDTDTVLSPRSSKFPWSFEDAAEQLPDPDDFVPDADEDPLSLQTTLNSLLPHDQLNKVITQKKAFYEGWREGPITFMPTYKYDIGSRDAFDTSEKQRAPSWCDRVLYRTRYDLQKYLQTAKDEEEVRNRDKQFNEIGVSHVIAEHDTLNDAADPSDDAPAPESTPVWDYDAYDESDDDASGEAEQHEESHPDRIRLEQYWSVQHITSSDHKPVTALFTVDYDAVVPDLRAVVQAEVARDFDRAENEGRPDITVVVDNQSLMPSAVDTSQGETVDFGKVSIFKRQVQSLTVANTGQVPATFSFVERPDYSGDQPVWLASSFVALEPIDDGDLPDLGNSVTLQPGGTVGIQLETLVEDFNLVWELNAGSAKLDDVLVLRVENGRDHFVPVHGEWLPSCIGRALNELIRVPDGGIQSFAASEKLSGSIPQSYEVRCSAPKELFKLVESLLTFTERATADESMLEGAEIPREKLGWPFEKSSWLVTDSSLRMSLRCAVLEALDLDRPINEAFPPELPALSKVEIVAEVLLLLLHNLTDGIITVSLWNTLEERIPQLSSIIAGTSPASQVEDAKTAILDILAHGQGHSISLVFLTSTLGRVCAELSPVTRADILAASTAFSPTSGLGFAARWRRSVSQVNGGSIVAVVKRRHRERKVAEIFAEAVCRGAGAGVVTDKERKAVVNRQVGMLELFIHRLDE